MQLLHHRFKDFPKHQASFPNLWQGMKYTDLHADDAVDEEDESYEDGYPGQGLEGFDEGPEEGPDALALAQQLDQPHHTEQTEEVDGNHVATRLCADRENRRSSFCLFLTFSKYF